jgi:hypothetical protein
VLGEEFRNRAIGRALLPQFHNHFPGGNQFLEALWPARCEFRDRLTD